MRLEDDDDRRKIPVTQALRGIISELGSPPLSAPVLARPDLRPTAAPALDEKLERLADARASIPAEFAWIAATTSAAMRARFAWYAAVKPSQIVHDLGDAPRIVSIVGPTSGIGKTTFAVRLLLWLLDRAMLASAPEAHVEMAARARFVPARDLVPPVASEGRSRLREALGAKVLILDDVGKEAGDSWEGKARAEQTRYLLESRFDAGRTLLTVQTTYLTRERYAALYDGGAERRYMVQDEHAGVLVYDFETMGRT